MSLDQKVMTLTDGRKKHSLTPAIIESRQKAAIRLQGVLAKFRTGEVAFPTAASPADLYTIMNGLADRGRSPMVDKVPVNWRREILFLLTAQDELPVSDLCKVIGVSHSTIQLYRRKDRELDTCIRAYQAAWFEREAMEPTGTIHPAILVFGLRARAGWKETDKEALSPDRLRGFIESVVSIINAEIEDPTVRRRVGRKILDHLDIFQSEATQAEVK